MIQKWICFCNKWRFLVQALRLDDVVDHDGLVVYASRPNQLSFTDFGILENLKWGRTKWFDYYVSHSYGFILDNLELNKKSFHEFFCKNVWLNIKQRVGLFYLFLHPIKNFLSKHIDKNDYDIIILIFGNSNLVLLKFLYQIVSTKWTSSNLFKHALSWWWLVYQKVGAMKPISTHMNSLNLTAMLLEFVRWNLICLLFLITGSLYTTFFITGLCFASRNCLQHWNLFGCLHQQSQLQLVLIQPEFGILHTFRPVFWHWSWSQLPVKSSWLQLIFLVRKKCKLDDVLCRK